jgi:hypothetical protein
VALSRLEASKGGQARAAALSPSRCRSIARKAVKARWDKKRLKEQDAQTRADKIDSYSRKLTRRKR